MKMVVNFLVINTEKTIRNTFSQLILTIVNFCIKKYETSINLTETIDLE